MALGNNLRKQGEQQDMAGTEPPSSHRQEKSRPSEPHQSSDPDEKKSLDDINDQVRNASVEKEDAGKQVMLIVFEVGKEEFALSIEEVREVVKTPHIARIPQLPAYIPGVANVRGNVLAVVDLGIKMNLVSGEKGHPEHLMVIKSDLYHVAIGIDKVPNTLVADKSEIDHSEGILHAVNEEPYIKGIVRKDKRMVILLDILEMVSDETFAVAD